MHHRNKTTNRAIMYLPNERRRRFILLLIVISEMPTIIHGGQHHPNERPVDYMADLTNDLGVKVLQILASAKQGNIAFSPYGLASVSILLFEGSTGHTALELYTTLNLPWNTLYARFGFRDLNRHLRTYFRSDGFLRGLVMSRDNVCFHYSYQRLLRLYGFEEPDTALTYPCNGFIPYSPPTEATTTASAATNASSSATPAARTDSTNGTSSSPTTTVPSSTVPDTATSPSETTEIIAATSTAAPTTTAETAATSQPAPSIATTAATTSAATETPSPGTVVTEQTQTSQTIVVTNTTTETESVPSEQPSTTTSAATETTTEQAASDVVTETVLPETQQTQTAAETPEEETPAESIQIPNVIPTTRLAKQTHSEPNGNRNDSKTNTLPSKESPSSSLLVENKKRANNLVTPNERLYDKESFVPTKPESFNYTKIVVNGPTVRPTSFAAENQIPSTVNHYHYANFSPFEVTKSASLSSGYGQNGNTLLLSKEPYMLKSRKFWKKNNNKNDNGKDDKSQSGSGESNQNDTESTSSSSSSSSSSSAENHRGGWFKFVDIDEELEKFFNSSSFPDLDLESFEFSDSNETDSSEEFSTEFNFWGAHGSGKNFKKTKFHFRPEKESNNSSDEESGHRKGFSNGKRISDKIDNFFRKMKKNWKKNCTTDEKTNSSNETTSEQPQPNGTNSSETEANEELSTEATTLYEEELQPQSSILSSIRTTLEPYFYRASGAFKSVFQNIVPFDGDNRSTSNDSERQHVNGTEKMTLLNDGAFDGSQPAQLNTTAAYGTEHIVRCNVSKNCPTIDLKYNLADYANNIHLNRTGRSLKSDNEKTKDDYKQLWFDMWGNTDTIWFSVSDSRRILVPTFFYSALLPFAFIPELNSQVVELPLDDPRYSLMVLLPVHRLGTEQLLSSLSYYPVRKIYSKLRPTAVYAVIPTIRMASQVDLRPAMYKLGVRDVFYRYRADLSKMSPDERLYVRGIEQVVTVSVIHYPSSAYEIPKAVAEHYFIAAHPFVFFVLDKETKVSLVAGVITDPNKQSTSLFAY